MKLCSDSFLDGGALAAEFAFAAIAPASAGHVKPGGNRNPHLAWEEVPNGTESLALFCIDGDAPLDATDGNQTGRVVAKSAARGDFFHWSLLDLPSTLRHIGAGQLSNGITARGKGPGGAWRQGLNDYTGQFAADPVMAGDYYGYDGPCPPWNDDQVHHYIFRLYAIDEARLALPPRFDSRDALDALHGHIIDEAQLIVTYTLNPHFSPALAASPIYPRKT